MIRIDVEFDLEEALQDIKKLEKIINSKRVLLMQKLAELGIYEARLNFRKAIYDGINDVVVEDVRKVDDNTFEIVARGNAIAFIEFGTGVYNPGIHPKAAELGAIRGQFGKKKGKNLKWYYVDNGGSLSAGGRIIHTNKRGDNIVETKGNSPNYSMYYSSKVMRKKLLKIAKEVFGD